MAPKGVNTKKESGRAKKADNEAKKSAAAAAEKERKESQAWQDGAKTKSKADEKEDKRKAELARKAENARLLAEEEAAAPSQAKTAPKAGSKSKAAAHAQKPAGPGAIAAKGGSAAVSGVDAEAEAEVESFAATGIDNALDLLEVVTSKMDKASVGQQAAGIERHPERRFKAAFTTYEERELPQLKVDYPGLRLQQYKDLLYKQFQKSPDNPFNQTTVAHDATKEDRLAALKQKKEMVEEGLRERM